MKIIMSTRHIWKNVDWLTSKKIDFDALEIGLPSRNIKIIYKNGHLVVDWKQQHIFVAFSDSAYPISL